MSRRPVVKKIVREYLPVHIAGFDDFYGEAFWALVCAGCCKKPYCQQNDDFERIFILHVN
jgi:hypothetical protein